MGLIPKQKIRGPNDALRKMREAAPNYDPIKEMTHLAVTTKNEELAFRCHKENAQYVYAKRKTMEIEGAGNENISFNLNFGGAPTPLENEKPPAIDVTPVKEPEHASD